MRLKTVLMASAAVMVGLTANAAQAGAVYGSFSGGLNWSEDPNQTSANPPGAGNSENVNLTSEDGFVVSVALGWHLDDMITPGLRVELEGGYRHNNANGSFTEVYDNVPVSHNSSSLGNDLITWSLMANLWYDFDMGHSLRPYFGGGIGWARNKLIPELTQAPTVESEGFAWQAGFGVNVAVSPAGSIGLGYRYMDSGDYGETFGSALPVGDAKHQSFIFSINYDLN